MPTIVLATLNARWAHCAFGLRYLQANLGTLADESTILEFDINQRTLDIMEAILARGPRILGLGVYVWNAAPCLQLVAELKRLRPELTIILGGPEVSYESDLQEITRLADYTISGEADLEFAHLCRRLLAGERPLLRTIAAEPPEFADLKLPYDLYDPRDLTQRTVYVEASRGCPFSCEFCLSSLEIPVRAVPLERFLPAMQGLLDRGLRRFKFVDRTFNLSLATSRAILAFFLERLEPGLFLHFEMIPDRLPEPLREVIARFPPGTVQLEVGVQTFNPAVAQRISRRQDPRKVEENLAWLRQRTHVHVHADLIAGLPGEDVASFAAGFDRLWRLGPQEIQIELLKRLRGTPIIRHDAACGMVYSPQPPYEVLQTAAIDFQTMQRLRRFARYWDLVANSGNFPGTLPLILEASPFARFMELSDGLHQHLGRSHGVALTALMQGLFEHLAQRPGAEQPALARALSADYHHTGRSDEPPFLRAYL